MLESQINQLEQELDDCQMGQMASGYPNSTNIINGGLQIRIQMVISNNRVCYQALCRYHT